MRKFFITLLIALILAFMLLGIFLPHILSSPLGKPLFEKALSKKLQTDVAIESLSLSWKGPQFFLNVNLSKGNLVGSIQEFRSDVPLWSLFRFGETFSLKNGSLSMPLYNDIQIENLQAEFKNHELKSSGNTNKGGEFTIEGTFHSKQNVQLAAKIREIPTTLFDYAMNAKGLLNLALGPTIDLSGTFFLKEINGAISLTSSSLNAQLSVSGDLKNFNFVLTKPLLASFLITPDFSDALLKHANAPFITSIESTTPITLHIPPNSTSAPLFSMNSLAFDQLHIDQGAIDLGKMYCTGGSSLVSFFVLLKSGILVESQFPIWFAPLSFSLAKGQLKLQRLDALLANTVHLCFWGGIDISNDQLKLFLGLPADTLANTLGLNLLSRKYVLKIPIYGSIFDPQFDLKAASGKIFTLTEQMQSIIKKSGPFGKLLGISKNSAEDQDIPPPNRPFPWE